MRYHNGVLRNEQDSTLRLMRYPVRRQLTWVEYLPAFVLGLLLAGMVMGGIFYY